MPNYPNDRDIVIAGDFFLREYMLRKLRFEHSLEILDEHFKNLTSILDEVSFCLKMGQKDWSNLDKIDRILELFFIRYTPPGSFTIDYESMLKRFNKRLCTRK